MRRMILHENKLLSVVGEDVFSTINSSMLRYIIGNYEPKMREETSLGQFEPATMNYDVMHR